MAPARVWDFISDTQRAPRWVPYLTSVRQISSEGGMGLEVELGARVAGQQLVGTGRCTAWEPPAYFALSARFEGGGTCTLEVETEPSAGGTIVYTTVDIELPSAGLAALAAHSVGERLLRQELARAMQALRSELGALAEAM